MTKHEAIYLASFLKHLGNVLANSGCNDLALPDTLQNRDLVTKASGERGFRPRIHNGEIDATDTTILDYLRSKFMEEHGLEKQDLLRNLF